MLHYFNPSRDMGTPLRSVGKDKGYVVFARNVHELLEEGLHEGPLAQSGRKSLWAQRSMQTGPIL